MARNITGTDMTNPSFVFALEIGYRDANPESDNSEVLATPNLKVFSNATVAAASNEGINIVEGDLWFFAADGSPLKALFSKEPYVDTERLKYFVGKYSLQVGQGRKLQEVISGILSGNPSRAQIIVRAAASNESAQEYGWSDVEAMKGNVERALKILSPDMAELVVFESCVGLPS
ncbi:MAG TPA: hypothetical protein VHZ78_11265 [Rhizomicrobium sp.]|jgi:hypothetical protein|nr:hypothetical protein [Rhizomicrobium sp.]